MLNSIVERYDKLKAITEWKLGYSTVAKLIEPKDKVILDYGCGNGRVSRYFVQLGAKKCICVDSSKKMMELAKRYDTKNIELHHIQNNNISFINSNSVDGAMLNFVLIDTSSRDQILEIFREIYRVLKTGSPLVILGNNPKSFGKEFISFKVEASQNLKGGQRIKVLLKGKDPIEMIDYFWSQDDCMNLLQKAGFKTNSIREPILPEDDKSENWINETKYPPFLIIKTIKS